MNKNFIKELIYTLIAIIIGILTIKFIIWALPVILIVIAICYIYKLVNKNKIKKQNKHKQEKKKPIKIIDMVEEN